MINQAIAEQKLAENQCNLPSQAIGSSRSALSYTQNTPRQERGPV